MKRLWSILIITALVTATIPVFGQKIERETNDGSQIVHLKTALNHLTVIELREPVIDQTGLTGLFNYTLDINAYVTDEIRKSGGDGPPLEANSIIASAMQEQLGLKVEAKKTPVSMLIVEHLEKSPTEN